jgi:hypothetical protein
MSLINATRRPNSTWMDTDRLVLEKDMMWGWLGEQLGISGLMAYWISYLRFLD